MEVVSKFGAGRTPLPASERLWVAGEDGSGELVPVPRLREGHMFVAKGQVVNYDGSIDQETEWSPWMLNALADEGEASMLNVYLKEAANVSKYLALIDGTTTAPAETSTMAYLGGGAGAKETQVPAANGYNRQQILNTDWTDDGLISGDARFSAAEKTFGPASATWTANYMALVTAATGQIAGSGKFLLYLALSATTTIAINQSFKLVLRWTQQ